MAAKDDRVRWENDRVRWGKMIELQCPACPNRWVVEPENLDRGLKEIVVHVEVVHGWVDVGMVTGKVREVNETVLQEVEDELRA